MRYIDLHCDTVTVCFDGQYSLVNCPLQTNLEKLQESGCAAQCFAIFTQCDAAVCFERYLGFYRDSVKKYGVKTILCHKDLEECLKSGKTGAIPTVENLGFITQLSELQTLASAGVKMASLVWNYENALAYPNLIFDGGQPLFEKRETRGLKESGRRTVEALDSLKIMIDISHLSDGGAKQILCGRKTPIVASHSGAAAVCNVSRNLTDSLIKQIADCGGVIGVNFCKDFLGDGETFNLVLGHINHIIKVGGEDAVSFGSDFDGIPEVKNLEDCTRMPALLEYLHDNGLTERVLEKLCYKNFARVFKEVCG